jgi:hypothetical protein
MDFIVSTLRVGKEEDEANYKEGRNRRRINEKDNSERRSRWSNSKDRG